MNKIWVFLTVLVLPKIVAAQPDYDNCPMSGMMYGNNGIGIMVFGWTLGLLAIIALILFISWSIKEINKK